MLLEGIKLAFLGIFIVFAFLTILIGLISLSTLVLKPLVEKEKLNKKKPR
jgi:Na+-transporting methylmalonyl-CoA/oxaloacetate decarboxylase gamma subunit